MLRFTYPALYLCKYPNVKAMHFLRSLANFGLSDTLPASGSPVIHEAVPGYTHPAIFQ